MKYSFFIFLFLVAQMAVANPASLQLQKATEQAKRLIKNATVDTAKHYCVRGSLTCRSIFTYKTKNGIKLKHFVQVFMSSDRQVGSAGYFFPNSSVPNQYFRYEDMNFNGSGNIEFDHETAPITVFRTKDNSVEKMIGMRLDLMGTTQFVMADLLFSEESVVLQGIKYDSTNPMIKDQIRLEYFRVNP
jgi:hypothetical protein